MNKSKESPSKTKYEVEARQKRREQDDSNEIAGRTFSGAQES